MTGAVDHLKTHQKFPATKAQLMAECKDLSDFSEEDKMEFVKGLSDKTYNSAEDVMKDLHWN
ncbi:MAG: hypothetical protein Q8P89_03595 [bacterium]|nr:hypothetical protein [bacterium]